MNTGLLINAAAADTDGNVTKVQFYANSVLIGTDTVYPYSTEWTPTSVAHYQVEARATDNDGNLVTGSVVTVNVDDLSGGLPSVAVNSPASGSTVQTGSSTSIIVAATDGDGSVASVQVYLDGQPLGAADVVAPYVVEWTPTSPGVYSLTARATDNSGNQSSSAAVSVTAADSSSAAPTVSIVTPSNGDALITGCNASIIASALDSDGQVASVQFFVDGKPQGEADTTEPYVTSWIPSSSGTYSLHAVAVDGSGNQTTSASVSVAVVANGSPAVAMISPSSGTSVQQGTPVSLLAEAGDTDGTIVSVAFLVNGIQIASANSSPFTATWTPQSAGAFSIVARAFDNSGNQTNSTAVTVNASANGAPDVALTFPSNGASVLLGSSVELQATTTDTNGSIDGVDFFANGVQIGARDTAGPFSVTWMPNSTGVYRLEARATDNGGLSALTELITVAVLDADDADTLYSGIYLGGTEQGSFTMAKQGSRGVTLIAYSNPLTTGGGDPEIYFYTGAEVDAGGDFSLVTGDNTMLSGETFDSGVVGHFDGDRVTFSGTVKIGGASNYSGPTGVVYGSLAGIGDSMLIALIGTDASVTFYVTDGDSQDVSEPGNLSSDGGF